MRKSILNLSSSFRNFLIAEGILTIFLAIYSGLTPGNVGSILVFPFYPLALMMRNLSLLGGIWNTLAWAVYLFFSLLPAAACLVLILCRKFQAADSLLTAESAILLYGYYLMINTGALNNSVSRSGYIIAFACGSVFYLFLLLWMVLRWWKPMQSSGSLNTTKAVLLAIRICFIILVFQMCYVNLTDLVSSLNSFMSGNSTVSASGSVLEEIVTSAGNPSSYDGYSSSYNMTVLNMILGMICKLIPEILSLMILNQLKNLVLSMQEAAFSEETILLSEQLSRRCFFFLVAEIAVSAAYNLLQFLFLSSLRTVNFSCDLPLLSIIVLMIAWIFSGYIKQGKALKDDNDSII